MTELLKPGDVLDDAYEIVEFISKGGFGAVYRARQLSMDRDVAVKLLIPGAQPDFEGLIQRFHNEVKAVRNLRHPNTVQIYDFHETSDAQLYFTMEYLDGLSLEDLIKQGEAISPRRTVNILSQVLKSLAEAHSMGIIHRDIKPANIMLVDMYGEDDFVKVLDFGIAKALHEGNAQDGDEGLTRTGYLVGTVRYMAPERIAGDPAGPYSDIYSLGLVGASLLIGQPILGNSSRLEAIQMQMGTKPLPIPQAVKTSAFGPLLDRALARNPKDRFQSAEEMLEHLSSMPASAFPAEPIHISGEIPILKTLVDEDFSASAGPSDSTDISEVEPTTIDSSLQPRPGSTAELIGGPSVPNPSSRPRTHDTASKKSAAGAANANASKIYFLLGLGGLLLVAAVASTWFLTGGQDAGDADSSQDADAVVTATEPSAPVELRSAPSGARVLEDGKLLGVTPLEVHPAADRRLTLEFDGYKARPVELGAETPPVYTVELVEQRSEPALDERRAEASSDVDRNEGAVEPDEPPPSAPADEPAPKRRATSRKQSPTKSAAAKLRAHSRTKQAREERKREPKDSAIIPVFGSEAPSKPTPESKKEADIPVF